jgi:hypothetical protein
MRKCTSQLDYVSVAAPCNIGWDNMIGNERVRFCGQCSLNVYNLSAMTRSEAERLLSQAEGRLCVRYYRRADGTILTKNCPVGLRALKRRLSRIATASISAALSFFTGIFAVTGLRERHLIPTATQNKTVIKVNEELPEITSSAGLLEAPSFTKGEMVVGNIAPAQRWTGREKVITERHARFRSKKK